MTEWRPPAVNFFTVSGVAATRVSPGLISAGMPMRIELNPSGRAWIQPHMAPRPILYDAGRMDLGLRDKIAVITGSSRGLGLASAKALAAEGCFVTISGRTPATLHAAAREVATCAGSDDRVLAVEADLAHSDGVQRLIERTVDRFGGIDVLVNSLGIARGAGLLETSDQEWQEAFDYTVMPAVRASRLAVPHMQRRGGGAIVIIASIFGRETGGRMTYTAVKAGEIGLTKSLAQQLARFNIRVV